MKGESTQKMVENLIEPEVKEILDIHKEIIDKHTDQIQGLQIETTENKQRVIALESVHKENREDLKEIKNVMYKMQSDNSGIAIMLGQIAMKSTEANTNITTNKDDNKTKVLVMDKKFWMKIVGAIVTISGSLIGIVKLFFS